jgi:hypothetical protein
MSKVFIWEYKFGKNFKDEKPRIGIIADTLNQARLIFEENFDDMIYWRGAYSQHINETPKNRLINYINYNEPTEIKTNSKIFVMTSLDG